MRPKKCSICDTFPFLDYFCTENEKHFLMLAELDSQFFLFLNGLHADWLDPIMIAITQMWVWLPLYALWIFLAIKHYGKRSWWIFLAVGLVVLCSDQLSAHVCKPLFQRLRPCFNSDLEEFIYLPKGMAGGRFGFVSSHAANTFSIATFLTAALRKKSRWVGFTLFAWALISSYSRIYIGFHYPGDIIAGAILGILVGLIIRKLFVVFSKKIEEKKSEQSVQI